MQTEGVACALCGADAPTPFLEAEDPRGMAGERFSIVRCGSCGHLYTSPRPTAASIGRFYPSVYYDDNGRNRPRGPDQAASVVGVRERLIRAALRDHWGYPSRSGRNSSRPGLIRRTFTAPISWWMGRLRRRLDALPWAGEGRLLDFGCGGGAFLRLQRERGWRVAGMDFNESVAEELRSRDDLDVEAGSWPGPVMADRTFDAITAWHVIEHLPDPVGWIRQASKQLAPGGYVLIVCPRADSWAAKRFGANWTGYEVPRHFSHFTLPEMQRLLRDAGLEPSWWRSEARPATLRRSAKALAQWEQNLVRRWLWRRKNLCKLVAFWTRLNRRGDGMWILARKPTES